MSIYRIGMPERRLTSLTNNKRKILNAMGFKSIKAYRKENPDNLTDEMAYASLLGEYNYVVDLINEAQRRKKEVEAEEERRRKQAEAERKRQEEARRVAIENRKKLYISQLKNKVMTAERTNTKTTIPLDMTALNGDFDAFLSALNPQMRKYALTSGNTLFMLNGNTISKLRKLFANPLAAEFVEWESGNEILTAINENEPFVLTIYPIGYQGHFDKVDGGFFPYTHNLDIDLKRYSIFKTGTNFGDDINDENCLITSFKSAGYDTTLIKTYVKNQYVPMRYLKDIAEKMKVYITLKKIGSFKDTHKYGNPNDPHIPLGLLEKHYFLIEPVEYTSYSINNYFEVCKLPNWNKIYKVTQGSYHSCNDGTRFINSYDLISLLIANKETHLTNLDGVEIYKLMDYKNRETEIFSSLTYNDTILKWNKKTFQFDNPDADLKYNEPKKENEKERCLDVVFFDFETTTRRTDKTATIHKPYCCYTDKNRNGYWGDDCGKLLLNDMVNKYGVAKEDLDSQPFIDYVLLIAHNSAYDFRFLLKYAYRLETIEKGTGLMNASFVAMCGKKQLNIRIRDSLKMINMGLEKFGKTFNLDVKKEIMPYDLYTEENVTSRFIALEDCLAFVKEEEKKEYLANCERWDCLSEGFVDILKYSGEYCYMDCITLRDGYNCFRKLVKEAVNLDILNYLTLASMSHDYNVRQGCYDGVLQMSGIPRAFIQRCIVGGRTMCGENRAHHIKDKELADFDAVSLYPSAMAIMDGFLIGKPKIIKTFQPEKYDGYFICIKVTKVGKHQHFPLLSYKTEKGIRQFSNDMVDKIIYIDKIGLEDAVRFQHIEYEFINGYYYDEGHNNKINDVAKYLYTQRKKYKDELNYEGVVYPNQRAFENAFPNLDYDLLVENEQIIEGNALQLVFKELMNSGYGKSYMKPIDSDNTYVPVEQMDLFINRNYNSIKEATLLANNKSYKVSVSKQVDIHFNNAHVGVEILSMSKRIMNEVMCLAEDLGMYLYYQDTDSIHIDNSQIEELATAFKSKYGRELIGKNMGQFHTDFDMKKAKKHAPIVAIESIFLGKKCYIDKLQSVDKVGKTINDYHIRMKGVPCGSIKHKAEHEYDNDIMKIYKSLYDGDKISFDLIAVKPKFELCKNMNIITKTSFDRMIGFNYDENKSIMVA